MELVGELWDLIIIRPMINSLVLFYWVFFDNFGLSIIGFTLTTRLLMIPLTIRQARVTKAMSDLAPKAQGINAKYKDDPQRRSQETMKLYRESGVNPIGCLGPIVLQMPIFIGLFWALRSTLASTPEGLADLSTKLYPWLPGVAESIPIDPYFLGLNLGGLTQASPVGPFLAVLVAATTWLMQKMSSTRATSDQQAQTNRMLLWFMPIMIGVFSLNFETGLTLYWTASNVAGIIVQGLVGGWGSLRDALDVRPLLSLFSGGNAQSDAAQNKDKDEKDTGREAGSEASEQASASAPIAQEAASNEHGGKNGENARGGDRVRPKGARRRTRRGRNRRR